ncbi:MAG: CxxxxCH/CxxCH domain-containing protein, partial [Desulfuromonadaceae bacterium]|nr:CxxxxCH/CxxCH domain-containing protein [Desulfuromonadaceae bacterium]
DGSTNCGICHGDSTTLSTGSHAAHLAVDNSCSYCHSGANTDLSYVSANHVNGLIDVDSTVGYSVDGQRGNGYGFCSTAICHGSIPSPQWGSAMTGIDSCTKCHGTPTAAGTINSSNRYLVAPADPAATDTGQVSTNPKTGAHQTHLRFFNGFSNYSTVDYRCESCHGSPLPTASQHMASLFSVSTSDPTSTFSGLATHNNTMSPGSDFNATTGACSNTYCHNPAGSGGTLAAANAGNNISPTWTDAAYITDGPLKTDANCNQCHLSPNGSRVISSTMNHSSYTITTPCTPCHSHEGGAGGSVGRQHIDGFKWGSGGAGGCVGCHGYGVGTWETAPTINIEGKGAHEAHITYLTTKLFTVTLDPLNDTYGGTTAAWTNVCGICHAGGTHNVGAGSTVDVSVGSTYQFGSVAPQYSGLPGTSSAADAKTCSNISCHYFTTPLWSLY